jgi:DNA-binding LacI/PurR family transcriptional regulator
MFSELWHRMVSRLGEDLRAGGYEMQLVPTPPQNCEWDQMFLEQRFDACIVFHEMTDSLARSLEMAQIPVVLVNALHPAHPSVVPDDRQGAASAAAHLIEAGHEAIVFLTSPSIVPHYSIQHRIDGYRQAMTEAGLERFICSMNEDPLAALETMRLQHPAPTAVVAYNDRVAVPLLHACWKRGVRVPDDLSVVTFNDVLMTRHSIPPLTTIDLSAEAMADRAATMLLERIRQRSGDAKQGVGTAATVHAILPTTLIRRESTRSIHSWSPEKNG